MGRKVVVAIASGAVAAGFGAPLCWVLAPDLKIFGVRYFSPVVATVLMCASVGITATFFVFLLLAVCRPRRITAAGGLVVAALTYVVFGAVYDALRWFAGSPLLVLTDGAILFGWYVLLAGAIAGFVVSRVFFKEP